MVARSSDTAAVTSWAQQFRDDPGVESLAVTPLGTTDHRVDIRVAGVPTSDEAQDLVKTIRAAPAPFDTLTTGQAAAQIDFLASMSAPAPYAVGLVVLGTLVLLFLMTGSVIIPVKALLLNIISLGAALGVVRLDLPGGPPRGPAQLLLGRRGGVHRALPRPGVRLRPLDGLRGLPALAHRRVSTARATRTTAPSRSASSGPAASSPPRRCSSASSSPASSRVTSSSSRRWVWPSWRRCSSTPPSCGCCSCPRR